MLVAAVIAAAGIAGCIWAASAALGHPVWQVPHRYFAGPLQDTHWNDTATLATAAAVALFALAEKRMHRQLQVLPEQIE